MTERPSDKAPWPKAEEELVAYIREMVAWPDGATDLGEGYGRCVYSMAYASVATFNYIASKLGVTGFQASCADMEILTQTRGYKHGFILLDANDLLYPQYNIPEKVAEWIDGAKPRLAEAARELLKNGEHAVPAVRAHWERVARGEVI